MKKTIVSLCLSAMLTTAAFAASSRDDLQARIDAAKEVLDQVMAAQDRSIPMNILQQATCVGVVPGLIKGAFVFGAQYGQGVVTCRTGHGWSAPVFIRMAGGSFGFQIGGQSTDLVLIAINDRGFQDLLKSKFKIGGDAAASAGPVGRNTQAATDWNECRAAHLLAQQRPVCGHRPGRHQREPEQGRHRGFLRSSAKLRFGSQGQRECPSRGSAVCKNCGEIFCRIETA
jgi:lipid-binding SYLF domain-containing protein